MAFPLHISDGALKSQSSPCKKRSRLGDIDLNDPTIKNLLSKKSEFADELTEVRTGILKMCASLRNSV